MSDKSHKGTRAGFLVPGPAGHHHGNMSSSSFRGGPGEHEPTWANETLPLSVRKEMLERDLKKLALRQQEGARQGASMQQQQQPQPGGHPQADGAASHGD